MAHFVIYLHEANQYQVIVGHYGLNRLSYPGGPNLRFVSAYTSHYYTHWKAGMTVVPKTLFPNYDFTVLT